MPPRKTNPTPTPAGDPAVPPAPVPVGETVLAGETKSAFLSVFAAQVTTTPNLDVKTYRLANRVASAEDERALAERVLQLELAPADLKAQATALRAG